ncbi:MAG: Amuc_1100 family pilus-like protein [Chthoniobacteraceae bacterium]
MKENKVLTGFLIVTALGALVLGFMLFRAKSRFTEAYDDYTAKVGELQSLQGAKPYPDAANLKQIGELQMTHQMAIGELQKQLAAAELPVEPISPEKFQDNLRAAIKRVRTLAVQKNPEIKMPEKFSLGFELYESQPPKAEAAAPLGRMLAAIEAAVSELLNTAPTELVGDIKRTPLPEEGIVQKGAAQAPPPQSRPAAPGGRKPADEQPLVRRYPFDIAFVARETKVRNFINKLVANKQQFFIPATVTIANELLTGPSKGGQAAPAEPPPTPPPGDTPPPPPADPNAPAPEVPVPSAPPTEATKFVVGEEKLQVTMRIEVVDFADPSAAKPDTTRKPAK